MKKLWNSMAFLAVVNLLAVGGFVAWLGASDRLSKDRLWSIREMLKTTVTEQTRAEAKATSEAEAKALAAKESERRSGAPVSSGQKIEEQNQALDLIRQEHGRLQEEARQLKEQIQARRSELDAQVAALEASKRAFEQEKADWQAAFQDEQFKQAVATLAAQKAADAAKVLTSILEEPAPAQMADAQQHYTKQRDKVIRYLAAMPDRSRSKIVAEFIKTNDVLAADLLEALRTRGGEKTAAVPVQLGP